MNDAPRDVKQAGTRPMPTQGRRAPIEFLALYLPTLALLALMIWSMMGARGYVMGLDRTLSALGMRGAVIYLPVLILALAALGVFLSRRSAQRACRRVVDAEFRLCLRCRYRLEKSIDAGVCPECGTEFTSGGLVMGWSHTYERELKRGER